MWPSNRKGGAVGFWPHSNSFLKGKQSRIKSQIVLSFRDWEDDSCLGTQAGPGLKPMGWGMRDCIYNIVVNYRNGDRILGAHKQATIVKSVSYKYNESPCLKI